MIEIGLDLLDLDVHSRCNHFKIVVFEFPYNGRTFYIRVHSFTVHIKVEGNLRMILNKFLLISIKSITI